MIWDFTEFRTNKKKMKILLLNENFTRADVEARLYLIDFKFPAKHAGCHFSLISDVTPSIPIYLFSLTHCHQRAPVGIVLSSSRRRKKVSIMII